MKPPFFNYLGKLLILCLAATALFTACEPEDDDFFDFRPVDFFINADTRLINAGETITYQDSSSNATSREWTFEGGSPATSSDAMPTVTYDVAGDYLTFVTTNFQDGTKQTRRLAVTVVPQIVADFTADPPEQTPDNPITLQNLTQGVGDIPAVLSEADSAIIYQWVIEGYPDTIWESNPVVSYSEFGEYDATLIVTRRSTGFQDIETKENFIKVVPPPVFDPQGISMNREGNAIFIRGLAAYATPVASWLDNVSLTSSGGAAVPLTGVSVPAWSDHVLRIDIDNSAMVDGDTYNLAYSSTDIVFFNEATLGAIDMDIRYGAAPDWEPIVYAGGNITTSFPLGAGTLNWANTGTSFAWQSNNNHNVLLPFVGFLAQAVNPNTDYTITSSVDGGASFDDIHAVGAEFFFIAEGSVITFSHPVTDVQTVADGMVGSLSPDGLTLTLTTQPNRNSVNRISIILENPADVENLVINHNAMPDLNLFVTFARF
ncbi:MAG: hypothetical protein AB8H12_10755 [Lewinella sp.]